MKTPMRWRDGIFGFAASLAVVLLGASLPAVPSWATPITAGSVTDALSFSTSDQGLYGAGSGTATLGFNKTLVDTGLVSSTQDGIQKPPNPAHVAWQTAYDTAYAAKYSVVYTPCIVAHPLDSSGCVAQAKSAATSYATTQAGPEPAATLNSGVKITASGSLKFGINGQVSLSSGSVAAKYASQATLSVNSQAPGTYTITLKQTPQSLELSSAPPKIAASFGDSFSTSGSMTASAYLDNAGVSKQVFNIPLTTVNQTLLSASIDPQSAQISAPVVNYTKTVQVPSIQNHQISADIPLPDDPEINATVPVANMGLQFPTLQSNQTIGANGFGNVANPTITNTIGPAPGGTICTATLSGPCPMEPTDFASEGLNVPFYADLSGLGELVPLGPGGIGIKLGVPETPITLLSAEFDYLTYYTEELYGLSQQLDWSPGLVATLNFSRPLLVNVGGSFVEKSSAQISPDGTLTFKDPTGGPLTITPTYSLANNEFTNTTGLYARFQQDINFLGYNVGGVDTLEMGPLGIPKNAYAYSLTVNTGNPVPLYTLPTKSYALGGFQTFDGTPLSINAVQSVPEPASLELMLAGGLALTCFGRKSKRRRT